VWFRGKSDNIGENTLFVGATKQTTPIFLHILKNRHLRRNVAGAPADLHEALVT
jgi:hypothetical protein